MFNERKIGRTGVIITAKFDEEFIAQVVAGKTDLYTTKIGWIETNPDYRGNGWAGILLQKVIGWARNNGSHEVTSTLIPVSGSEKAVEKLLGDNGFEINGNHASKNLKD